MRILIADDELVSRRMLERALKRRGYDDIVCAEDGMQAWEIIQSAFPPDIVLIDWMMPGVSGIQLCQQLRANPLSGYTYMILITAKNEFCDFVNGLGAGVDEYIAKPICNEELYLRLQSGARVVNSHRKMIKTNAMLAGIDHSTVPEIQCVLKMIERLLESSLTQEQRQDAEDARNSARHIESVIAASIVASDGN